MEPILQSKQQHTPVVDMLEEAIPDELMAAYQYWVAAYLVKGEGRYDAVDIFTEHVEQELKHANILAERIVELGGDLPRDIHKIHPVSGTVYTVDDIDTKSLASLILKAETGAVAKYSRIATEVRDSDPVTYKLVVDILRTEQEHRHEISQLLESI